MRSTVSMTTAIIYGGVGFLVGYVYRAVWQAFADLRMQKAKVKGARKAAWGWLWTMIKTGALALVVSIIFIAWVVGEARSHP